MHSLKNQTNDLDIALPTQESPSEDHPWNPKCWIPNAALKNLEWNIKNVLISKQQYKMITQQQMWYTAHQDYSQIP